MRMPTWIRQHLAALRALLVLTVIVGIAYPLAVTAVAQIPGLQSKADGSLISQNGKVVGSKLIGQSFTDANGDPLTQYFQSRPSAAGTGYDPTASGASNLGPESIVDTLPNPKVKDDPDAKQSLLTQVCGRSLAIGRLEGVSGARPFCTSDGVGAVLSVIGPRDAGGNVVHPTRVVSVDQECPATPFIATYQGVAVQCARYGEDYGSGRLVPIKGDAVAKVPADAVTASGSGLDPGISIGYADLQAARVARVRGIGVQQVRQAISDNTTGRALGFMGEKAVNVLTLNLELDRKYPYHA